MNETLTKAWCYTCSQSVDSSGSGLRGLLYGFLIGFVIAGIFFS